MPRLSIALQRVPQQSRYSSEADSNHEWAQQQNDSYGYSSDHVLDGSQSATFVTT